MSSVYPSYYEAVAYPMDLSTVESKLISFRYSSVAEFLQDVRIIWSNCKLANKPGSELVRWADEMSEYFEAYLKVGILSYAV